MPWFLDRTRRAGRFLEWKVAFFTVGSALALAGMALESDVLIFVAIGALAGGFGVRFLPGGHPPPNPRDD